MLECGPGQLRGMSYKIYPSTKYKIYKWCRHQLLRLRFFKSVARVARISLSVGFYQKSNQGNTLYLSKLLRSIIAWEDLIKET